MENKKTHKTGKFGRTYAAFSRAELQSTLRYWLKKSPNNLPPELVEVVKARYPGWTPAWGHYFTDHSDPKNANRHGPKSRTPDVPAAPTSSNLLSVTMKSRRSSKTGIKKNTIMINNQPVLKKHTGTQLQTFLNGQYLGIYGIPDGQTAPSWVVYDTDLRQRPTEAATDHSVKIVQVYSSPRMARLVLNNRINIILERDRTKEAIFVIQAQKRK